MISKRMGTNNHLIIFRQIRHFNEVYKSCSKITFFFDGQPALFFLENCHSHFSWVFHICVLKGFDL